MVKIPSVPPTLWTAVKTQPQGPPDSPEQGKSASAATTGTQHRAWHIGTACLVLGGTGLVFPVHDPGHPGVPLG